MPLEMILSLDEYFTDTLMPLIDLTRPYNALSRAIIILFRWVVSFHSLVKLVILGNQARRNIPISVINHASSRRHATQFAVVSTPTCQEETPTSARPRSSTLGRDASLRSLSHDSQDSGIACSAGLLSRDVSCSRMLAPHQSFLPFNELIDILVSEGHHEKSHNHQCNDDDNKDWFYLFMKWHLSSQEVNLASVIMTHILPSNLTQQPTQEEPFEVQKSRRPSTTSSLANSSTGILGFPYQDRLTSRDHSQSSLCRRLREEDDSF
jgi:hypothetical protein